ncbi:MAG: NUDIX hydrolase [Bacillota bacterium]
MGNTILKDAAVIVPVYRKKSDQLNIVLIRRSEHGIHGGQLAFPGGKYEERDISFMHTALRETEEEIGLKSSNINVLAQLPVLETLGTGYRIHPFLARIRPLKEWTIQESEVAEVLEVNLNELMEPGYHLEEMMKFDQWPKPVKIPYYKVGNYKLWGASYKILHPLLPCLISGKFDI